MREDTVLEDGRNILDMGDVEEALDFSFAGHRWFLLCNRRSFVILHVEQVADIPRGFAGRFLLGAAFLAAPFLPWSPCFTSSA